MRQVKQMVQYVVFMFVFILPVKLWIVHFSGFSNNKEIVWINDCYGFRFVKFYKYTIFDQSEMFSYLT